MPRAVGHGSQLAAARRAARRSDQPGLLVDRHLERLVLRAAHIVDDPHRLVGEEPDTGRAGGSGEALGAHRGLAGLRRGRLRRGRSRAGPAPTPRARRRPASGTRAAARSAAAARRSGAVPVGRAVRRCHPAPWQVDPRLPRLGSAASAAPHGSRAGSNAAREAGSIGAAPSAVSRLAARASQPSHGAPARSAASSAASISAAAGRVAGEDAGNTGRERAGRGQGRITVQARSGGRELAARDRDLAGGEGEEAAQERRRDARPGGPRRGRRRAAPGPGRPGGSATSHRRDRAAPARTTLGAPGARGGRRSRSTIRRSRPRPARMRRGHPSSGPRRGRAAQTPVRATARAGRSRAAGSRATPARSRPVARPGRRAGGAPPAQSSARLYAPSASAHRPGVLEQRRPPVHIARAPPPPPPARRASGRASERNTSW